MRQKRDFVDIQEVKECGEVNCKRLRVELDRINLILRLNECDGWCQSCCGRRIKRSTKEESGRKGF